MTAKDTLVEALRDEGWDFLSAYAHAQRFLDEFQASKDRKTTVHTQTKSFILRKIAPFTNCEDEQTKEQT